MDGPPDNAFAESGWRQAVRRELGGTDRDRRWSAPRQWTAGVRSGCRRCSTGAAVRRRPDRTVPQSAVEPAGGSGSLGDDARRWAGGRSPSRVSTTPPYGDELARRGRLVPPPGSGRRSPNKHFINLFCFSTVDSGGGGTLLVEGSHHLAARILWEAEPDGLEADAFDEPLTAILEQKGWSEVIEVVAEEGDVVLAHPLAIPLLQSKPRDTVPRVMAQPAFSMTEPKRTEGDQLYPVEIPLARARP